MDGALPPLARGVQGSFLKQVSVAVASLELHSLMTGAFTESGSFSLWSSTEEVAKCQERMIAKPMEEWTFLETVE